MPFLKQVEACGWHSIVRLRAATKLKLEGETAFLKLQEIHASATKTEKSLGPALVRERGLYACAQMHLGALGTDDFASAGFSFPARL